MSNTKYKTLYSDNKKSQVHSIFLIAVVLTVAFLIFNVVGLNTKLLIVLLGAIAFGIAFVNTEFALVLLIFSMLLSPEFDVAEAGRRAVTIRADDIFLGVVLVGWLARMAVNKELALLRGTPLNTPILCYIAIALISTLFGALKGSLSLLTGIFFTLKYIEYFLLFFMVANTLHEKRQVRVYVYSMLIVFFIISIYACFQHAGGVMRVSAPFEGHHGEANTLGGYLVFMIMISLGLFFNIQNGRLKIFLATSLVFAIPALLFTLSRGSWLACVASGITLFFVSKRGKWLMVLGMLVLVVGAQVIFPKDVKERFAYTFEEQTEYNLFGRRITLDESAAARVDNWIVGFDNWKKAPIIGSGVGGVGSVIDNQYTRTLSETGFIGFFFFFLTMWRLFLVSKRAMVRYEDDDFVYGLTCGFFAGIVAMLFHSLSAATFIIIRIAEPFWFVAAIVVMTMMQDIHLESPELENDSKVLSV